MTERQSKSTVSMKALQTGRATSDVRVPRDIVVVYRAVSALKLDPHNPRVHSPRQIRQIARSIEAFGFNVPVLVDSELKLIAGHGRVLAAQQLGLAELPTISLDHLTNAQARAFLIADNKLTDNSIWDDQLLAQQLRDLSLLDLDFSLEHRFRGGRDRLAY